MKSPYLYLIFFILLLNGCANETTIQKRENWLHEKISQLHCGDSIRINEMPYSYLVKRLRKSTTKTVFANKTYSIKKLNQSVYTLYGEDSLLVKIDGVFVGTSHGVMREMIINIKKQCR